MNGMRPRYLIALALAGGLVALYHFGRPLWYPVKVRLAGGKTVGQVVDSLRPAMSERFSGLDNLTDGEPLALLAFKEERQLEIWKRRGSGWEFIRSYPFTGYSGSLGPKLGEGDLQIPEGLYQVESLNPNSSYHLSIKVDYPNRFDREMAKRDGRTQLGGDIFIHGMSASIGCIPVGNEKIEELFYLVAENGYKNTEILIAPRDFRSKPEHPELEGIEWEAELYEKIADVLQEFPAPALPSASQDSRVDQSL